MVISHRRGISGTVHDVGVVLLLKPAPQTHTLLAQWSLMLACKLLPLTPHSTSVFHVEAGSNLPDIGMYDISHLAVCVISVPSRAGAGPVSPVGRCTRRCFVSLPKKWSTPPLSTYRALFLW